MFSAKSSLRVALVGASLAAGASLAQGRPAPVYPTLDLSRLELNAGAEDSLFVGTGKLLEAGRAHVSILGQYLDQPAYTRLGEGMANLRLGHRTEGLAQLAYAPEAWLQLFAQLPVVMDQAGAGERFTPGAANGLGAPTVGVRLGLVRQSAEAPFNIALGVAGGLPFGDAAALARDRQPRLVPSLSIGHDFGKVQLGLQGQVRLRSPENFSHRGVSASVTDTVGHEASVGLVAAASLTRTVKAELAAVADFALSDGASTVQTFGGIRYDLGGDAELFAGGGPAFGALVGTPTFRVLAGIGFTVGGAVQAAPAAVIAPPARAEAPVAVAEVKKVADPCASGPCAPAAEPDADGDGVADSVDRCVQQAGPKENGGCPAAKKQGVASRPKTPALSQSVHFAVQSAALAPSAEPQLEQLAALLKKRPELRRVRIEGHSDSVTDAGIIALIAQARADTVRDFLISRGVAEERLEAVGYGDERPVGDNLKEPGHTNRRVEFVIVHD